MSDWVITGPNETEFCFIAETKLGAEFATAPLVTMSDNGKPRQKKNIQIHGYENYNQVHPDRPVCQA
jgi:hypothetical protein